MNTEAPSTQPLQKLQALRQQLNASNADAQFKQRCLNVLKALEQAILSGRFTGASKIAVRELKIWISDYAEEGSELHEAYAQFTAALIEAGLMKEKEQKVDAIQHFLLQRNAWYIYIILIALLMLMTVLKDYWA